jgi:hypothetical protein
VDTLGEGAGDYSHLTDEQESKIKKHMAGLVMVQANTVLKKFKVGLVNQKPSKCM